MKTPFEIAQDQVNDGKLETPSVTFGIRSINYFGYQLAVHRFNLSIMSRGMKCRNIKFSEIKKYYGLKGKSAKECLPEFEIVMNKYLSNFKK